MQELNSIHRRFAEFYRLYVQDFRRDIPLYLELAAKHGGPVLEVGCRTGRVAAHLGAAGWEVLGVDRVRPMLEVAVDQLRPWRDRVRVADFDLRRNPLPERFPVAFVTLFSFNDLIDVEEQRLFLRHLRQSMTSPGVVVLDLFCPLALVRPAEEAHWRELVRISSGRQITVRDKREMLTPLLERRVQDFRVEGGPEGVFTSHRRYLPPLQGAKLLGEAGFGRVNLVQNYDLSTAQSVGPQARPGGPFILLAEL